MSRTGPALTRGQKQRSDDRPTISPAWFATIHYDAKSVKALRRARQVHIGRRSMPPPLYPTVALSQKVPAPYHRHQRGHAAILSTVSGTPRQTAVATHQARWTLRRNPQCRPYYLLYISEWREIRMITTRAGGRRRGTARRARARHRDHPGPWTPNQPQNDIDLLYVCRLCSRRHYLPK